MGGIVRLGGGGGGGGLVLRRFVEEEQVRLQVLQVTQVLRVTHHCHPHYWRHCRLVPTLSGWLV